MLFIIFFFHLFQIYYTRFTAAMGLLIDEVPQKYTENEKAREYCILLYNLVFRFFF